MLALTDLNIFFSKKYCESAILQCILQATADMRTMTLSCEKQKSAD